jgi:cell division inhibitor SepF
MASAMRKMAVYLGLVEDDRYDDRYGDDYDEGFDDFGDDHGDRHGRADHDRRDRADERSVETRTGTLEPAAAAHTSSHAAGPADGGIGAGSAADRIPAAHQPITTDLARITTLHPRTYNEARTIGEHFREGIPVIMNLTEMSDSDAKRLVDFAAGLIFGLHGSIERVTNKVFLLSPVNVEVTAEDKARIAERNFFNQS